MHRAFLAYLTSSASLNHDLLSPSLSMMTILRVVLQELCVKHYSMLSSLIETMLKAYSYISVDPGDKSIRFLTLFPGQFSAPIEGTVEVKVLSDKSHVDFEALSYTWGSPDEAVDIFLREGESYFTLSATKNLAEALPYLRYKDKARLLWIDAICVNQKDIPDRNYHDSRMADIYSKARRVIVWLGPESDDSRTAIDIMGSLISKAHVDGPTLSLKPLCSSLEDEQWADRNTRLPFDEKQFQAVDNLLSRASFERLWIWQEIQLASNAIVMCGKQEVERESFKVALVVLIAKLLPPHAAVRIICPFSYMKKIHSIAKTQYVVFPSPSGHYATLRKLQAGMFGRIERAIRRFNPPTYLSRRRLLDFTKDAKCSDQRDRVFAILSVSPLLGLLLGFLLVS